MVAQRERRLGHSRDSGWRREDCSAPSLFRLYRLLKPPIGLPYILMRILGGRERLLALIQPVAEFSRFLRPKRGKNGQW